MRANPAIAILLAIGSVLLPGCAHKAGTAGTASASKRYSEYRVWGEKGDAKFQDALGICYATGQAVAKDVAEAAK